MSSEIMTSEPTIMEVVLFFAGIFGVIVITDTLKIILAKRISKYLKAHYILIFRKIVGVVLFVGGLILIYRTAF
ncbi:MAG: hypothetical protein HC803_08885 [Saprospiraceae bacterium]|nr:hypothetical protein [Saprospiraceae bacterium]